MGHTMNMAWALGGGECKHIMQLGSSAALSSMPHKAEWNIMPEPVVCEWTIRIWQDWQGCFAEINRNNKKLSKTEDVTHVAEVLVSIPITAYPSPQTLLRRPSALPGVDPKTLKKWFYTGAKIGTYHVQSCQRNLKDSHPVKGQYQTFLRKAAHSTETNDKAK